MAIAIPIAVNDILQVTIGCYFAGQAALNVMHYRVSVVTGTILTLDVAEDIDTSVNGFYKAVLTNTASYYGVRVQRVLPGPKSDFVVAADNVGVGTAGADPLPSQVCGLVSWQTGLAGQRNRGRIFIPFPDEDNNDPASPNRPDGGYLSSLEDLAEELGTPYVTVSGANNATLLPVILHRDTGTTTEIEGHRVRDAWATQRRRGSLGQGNKYPPF